MKGNIRFWASPWTPPTWMKTRPRTQSGQRRSRRSTAARMKSDDATMKALAQYLIKLVQAYAGAGHHHRGGRAAERAELRAELPVLPLGAGDVRDVRRPVPRAGAHDGGPQPRRSCSARCRTAAAARTRRSSTGVMADATREAVHQGARPAVGHAEPARPPRGRTTCRSGRPSTSAATTRGTRPARPTYKATAPNDQAYAVESWGHIRDSIKGGRHRLQRLEHGAGHGRQGHRHDARLGAERAADGQHVVEDAEPDAGLLRLPPRLAVRRAGRQGRRDQRRRRGRVQEPGRAIVAVMYNSGGAKTTIVSASGKKLQFSMPGSGWATVVSQ